MKTIKEITEKINELQLEAVTEYNKGDYSKRFVSGRKNKIAMLKLCRSYLETNPSDSFIIKERDRLNNRLELIDKQFVDYLKFNLGDKKKLREIYNREYDVEKLYKQLRALDFILT